MFSTVLINQALLLNFIFKISVYLLLPLKSSVHDTYILPHPVSLLLGICFELPITRTLVSFPRRFELSQVVCTSIIYIFKLIAGLICWSRDHASSE